MKTLQPLPTKKNLHSGSTSPDVAKKHLNYYERFLQMLIRKTEAEKRAQSYGMDPFKK